MAEVSDNQKEFMRDITKVFSFEELAMYFYEYSCVYCTKRNKCMGNSPPKECAENIRNEFENSYLN